MRSFLAVLAGVTALAVVVPARAQDESGPPPGAERTRRPNTALLVAGGALFVGAYGGSIVVAATSPRDVDHDLYIPAVGPFIDLADRNGCNGNCTARERFYQASLVGAGAAQIVGVTLVVASLFVPERTKTPERAGVRVLPVSVNGGGGLAAFGSF